MAKLAAGIAVDYDLIVAGGGPAGSAAAIAALARGARVLLLERGSFPRHKVCGEFVSPESLGLLAGLGRGFPPLAALVEQAQRIARARVFLDGHTWELPVEPAAASIPRYQLDAALWQLAESLGGDCRQQVAVNGIEGAGPFLVATSAGAFTAAAVINASGRWSNLSPLFHVEHRRRAPKWLGIKGHFRERSPSPSVDLYFFAGGYCGVEPVADDRVNACAMVRADAATTLEEVLAQHPQLRERSRAWEPASEPVSTSPLIFRKPTPVRGGVLLAGDAAGFVDPFVGDGISLALRGGTLAAEALAGAWAEKISLAQAARDYERAYRRELLPVFGAAAHLRRLVGLPRILRAPLLRLMKSPAAARFMVRKTRARTSGRG